jgi:isopentenyldiphosphate isomerase
MKPVADKHSELLPYFDAEGNILGKLPREEIHSKGLINKHVAYFVTNQYNQLLLQLRAADKSVNPNQWDKPGGHVGIGASLTDEFLEEMCYQIPGINAIIVSPEDFDSIVSNTDLSKTTVLTKLETMLNYNARRVQSDGTTKIEVIHLEVFRGRYNGQTCPQPGEVQEIRPWSRDDLERAIKSQHRSIGYDTQDIMTRHADNIFSR